MSIAQHQNRFAISINIKRRISQFLFGLFAFHVFFLSKRNKKKKKYYATTSGETKKKPTKLNRRKRALQSS